MFQFQVSRAKLRLSAAVLGLDRKSRNAFVALSNAFPEANSTEDRLHLSLDSKGDGLGCMVDVGPLPQMVGYLSDNTQSYIFCGGWIR